MQFPSWSKLAHALVTDMQLVIWKMFCFVFSFISVSRDQLKSFIFSWKGQQTEIKKTKNKGEYPLILYTVNPSTSPGTFQCCLVNNLLFPCPSSWSSGRGACCANFRCVHLGELLSPLPGARLSGSCLSCQDPGGTTTVAPASSPVLESAPAVTTTAPSPQGPGCSREVGAHLHSSGPPVAGGS